MGKHEYSWTEKCKSCKGTGVYIGMCERDGAGVVCHTCEGTGKCERKIEWEDFEGKVKRENIERVYQSTAGIMVGKGSGDRTFTLDYFGGMPYEDWFEGKPFPPGSEMRNSTCPAWYYQSVDYKKKPDWDWCRGLAGCSFSSCKHFPDKAICWERWDKEFGKTTLEKLGVTEQELLEAEERLRKSGGKIEPLDE